MTASTERKPPPTRLTPTVKLLGAVSFLNDVASEMITPILPLFLTMRLGAGPAAVGLIEGLAEAASSLLKGWSGRAADRSRRTRGLVIAGYSVSNLVRPLVAFAGAWPVVLLLRFLDRVGKGIRTAPRDALISRASEPSQRGRAFGFHRAMDHLGATVGPLVAFALLRAGATLETVFLWSIVPGLALVALLLARLREPAIEPVTEAPVAQATRPGAVIGAVAEAPGQHPHGFGATAPPARLRPIAWAILLQAFATVPDAFLVLWAAERGVTTAYIPLIWAAAHLARSGAVRWAGGWSDGRNRAGVVALGWGMRVLGLGTLVWAPVGMAWTTAIFIGWAAIAASTEGPERALVSSLAAARSHGRAFGLYHMGIGLVALPGALLFGTIWQIFGFEAAFLFSAVGSAFAAGLMAHGARKAQTYSHPGPPDR